MAWKTNIQRFNAICMIARQTKGFLQRGQAGRHAAGGARAWG